MTTLQHSADAFRRALIEHDSVAERRLLDSYAVVWAAIRASLDALLADMAERQSAGLDVSPAWLFRQQRYKDLLLQVEQQVGGLARSLNGALQGQATYAAMLGSQNAVDLITQAVGDVAIATTFTRLPVAVVTQAVAALSPSSPLSAALAALGSGASDAIRRALIVGVATGQNPRVIARLVRDQAGITLTRALTISRTETLRAYRSAALDTYQANGDVVEGWVWHSALGTRTCPFCWANHGRFFPLSEPFASHPNCRCAPIPSTRSYAELGIEGRDKTATSGFGVGTQLGSDLFDDLDPAQQRRILGPGAYSLYADGDIALADMASFGHSQDWGRYGYTTPLYRLKRRVAA